jgi:hypothetical protein
MQELLKLQAAMTEKNTLSINLNTHAANDLKVDVKKLSETQIKAANDEEYKKKSEEQVSESLKQLNATIRVAIKNGFGEATAKRINENNNVRGVEAGANSGLRELLLGGKSDEEVQGKSITGFTGVISKLLAKREEKQALKQEKKEFVQGALGNDKRAIALKNLKGEDYAKADAEKRFEEIKAKEKEIAEAQRRVDASKAAGYAPKKKDLEAVDKGTKELATMDPRMKSTLTRTAQEEAQEFDKKVKGDTVKAQGDEVAIEHGIGKSLIESLDVQKQQLAALQQLIELGGTGGGGGGSTSSVAADLAEAALDNSGNGKGGKGKFLGKAGKFLARNAGKLGAVAGIAGGAYEAYTGYNDAEEAVQRGEITKEEGQVKKGEAVGGGVGGAGGALAGAAAGAAIGSVVPVVGTAIGGLIGGALGYYGGSKVGSAVGGAGVKAAQGFQAGDTVAYDEMGNPIGSAPTSSEKIETGSKTNESLKVKGNSSPTVVNAPTTINNNSSKGGSVDIRAPLRNQESSVNSYIQNRYA